VRHDGRMRIAVLVLAALLSAASAMAQTLKPVDVAKGLEHPWGLAFLPDGSMLVSERPGRLRIVERDGRLGAPLAGVPAVAASGQGGLLDVALHPQFASNQLVYWSFSEPGDGGAGTAVARGRLEGQRLADVQVIFRQQPKVSGGNHFGSRLVWDRDGRLFVTLGDRFSRKDDAQRLDNHIGKLVRIDADGRAPADNPFVKRDGARPEIWSYGHRNMQGAALHPDSGELWTTEHGPQGGDELNVPAAGANHGWPVITHGRNYGIGTRIGEGTERNDVAAPLRTWLPTSIAPSGMAFLTSERYPGWKGNLFVGALRGAHLVRLELDGRKVLRETSLLTDQNARIRDVRQGPDGWLYVLTDSPDGQLWRLER
jgi:glucose/arabinose dehydrogenase